MDETGDATDALAAMPKVELHVHLEGSVQPETLLALARTHGVPLPATGAAGLREWYRFRDFPHFAQIYDTICDCVVTPDDLTLLVTELGAAAARENIRYMEVTTTTNARLRRGLSLDDQRAALVAGADAVRRVHGVRIQFVVDIVPEQSYDEAFALARWAVANHGRGVCALGLAGTEAAHDKAALAPVFAYARDAGLPRTIHAGETLGPGSVWDALALCHADRIGHGVRAIEDTRLVARLAEAGVHLEICPTSNLLLGVYPEMAAHPVRRLWDAGVNLSIATDDPPLFNVSLTGEYRALAAAHGFTPDDFRRMNANAARAAFLPDDERAALLAELAADDRLT